MVRGRPISADMRKLIVKLSQEGKSGHNIAAIIGISRSSVRNIINLFKKTRAVIGKPRPGRNKSVSGADLKVLGRIIKRNRRLRVSENLTEWRKSIKNNVSRSTCLRYIKSLGYSFYKVNIKRNFTYFV